MKFTLSKNSAITIHRYDSYEELAQMVTPALQSGSVSLSGGSTYKELCKALAKLKPDLSMSWFCATDERVVPFEDPNSNWGSVVAPMLDACGIPEQSYNHYETEGFLRMLLRNRFDTEPYLFDAVFLGVGEDGHLASLFPGTTAINDMKKSILSTKSPKGVENRITLGPRVIVDAQRVVVVMAGASKESCIDSMLHHELTVPFLSILSRRAESEMYLDAHLYDYLKATVSSWL